MTTERVFKLFKSGVATEHFDNEIILLNLPKGNYYSIRETGFELWNQLVNGMSQRDMVQFMAARFDADVQTIEKDVLSFIDQLLVEGLIVTDEEATPSPFIVPVKAQVPYTKPELEVYSDMQDILMLDPIHDVDSEKGWPIRK